jgi:putative Holliday junction resolvase
MRYLGIDYGTKKVGLALSDEAGTMGFPHATELTTPKLIETVLALIEEKNVEAVVVGESRNLEGGENEVARAARAFGKSIEIRADIPVFYEPETFTTQEARRYPDGTRMAGSPDVDASAAALILTRYFERNTPDKGDKEHFDIYSADDNH